jgi:cation diffusion facilitator family transporter
MAGPDATREQGALRASIAVTSVLGALGVAWGITTGSQMILLDGVYAFVGVAVSWLLIRASVLAQAPPSRRFPFGLEAATPLVIGIQGCVLLATLGYAAVEAFYLIRQGGTEVTAGWAAAYGTIATVASLATWRWLQRISGTSDLLIAEATAWRVAAFRGVGMVVGFSILALLQGSAWDQAAPYVDPAMVLVTCVAFLPGPLRMVRETILELLEAAPDEPIQAAVVAAVGEVRAVFDLGEARVLATKVGPKLYVEVAGEVDGDLTVTEEHRIRLAMEDALTGLPYEVWLNLELLPAPTTSSDVVGPVPDDR